MFALPLTAYPPAPHHLFHGLVRDDMGNPLSGAGAEVTLETPSGTRLQTEIVDGLDAGENYRLPVPMDAGLTQDLYKPIAMVAAMPFRLRVRIGQTSYLPLEMRGDFSTLGKPGGRTRLDLTLGEDADGDGIPDAWERALLAQAGGELTLADIQAADDFDGDGLSNLEEYLAGTYAFDSADGFAVKMIEVGGPKTVLEFLALRGRTYSVYGSADLAAGWTQVDFQVQSGPLNAAAQSHFHATDVAIVRVEVTAGPESSPFRFFKLLAQ